MSGVHRNGKIEIVGRVRLQDAEDLARHYTPGVAELAEQAGREPGRARGLTGKGNAIAIVTDGSALLGLGDQGPRTAGRAAGNRGQSRAHDAYSRQQLCAAAGGAAAVVRVNCDPELGSAALRMMESIMRAELCDVGHCLD